MSDRVDRLNRIGLVVHPTRDVDAPLGVVRAWAEAHGAELAQIPLTEPRPEVGEERSAGECDLVVAIGGDGTTLAAIRAAAEAHRPVLGAACGSLGVLTVVPAQEVGAALDRFVAGDWTARPIPALRVLTAEEELRAFNDLAVVRQGSGQLRVTISVDGVLYARLAGDGCVVATPVGSSAYTIAARGPLLAPAVDALVVTPLPTHGGFCPPIVVAGKSEIELEPHPGFSGGRLEIDGREVGEVPGRMTITLAPHVVSVVSFSGAEPHLTGLRRRGIVTDSPRILVDEQRE